MSETKVTQNHRWILATRPAMGKVDTDKVFKLETAELPKITGENQVVVRTLEFSLDPAMRGWIAGLSRANYRAPVPVGGVMEGSATGVVIESSSPKVAVGDHVFGTWGWQEYALLPDSAPTKLPKDVPTELFLGAAGITGITAYFGLIDVGQPKAGETILVSGAAGATGSIVGQIAKILGLRVVGTAGTDEKCEWLKSIGFDAAINYKKMCYKELAEAISQACPNGIDIYFDNTGGDILEIALDLINLRGRVVVCGAISGYNAEQPLPGPRNLFMLIIKRVRMEGFLVMDYFKRIGDGRSQLLEWIKEGKIKHRETIIPGFENLPKAFNMLFEGANIGKLMVRP